VDPSWASAGGSRSIASSLKVVAIVVFVAGVLVLTYFALRPKPAPQAGTVVGFSAPPPRPTALRVVILKGGSTGCQPTGGCNNANYSGVLSAKEGWSTTVLAKGGTGYVNGSDSKPPQNFGSRLSDVYNASPELVIVEGSVSDQYYSGAAIEQAAVTVFTSLKAHLPNAKVVVVGPAWAGTAPTNVLAIESAVRSAAAGRVAEFIDPIAEGWFSGANASLMAADHQSPTNQGHALIASRIAADLTVLGLQATSSSPAA